MTVGELTEEVRRLRAMPQTAKRPAGERAVFVIDRGWIFAGDATKCADGYVRLERAVWLFKWQTIGFSAVVSNPKQDGIDIRKSEPVEIPTGSIIFRIPVSADWGL